MCMSNYSGQPADVEAGFGETQKTKHRCVRFVHARAVIAAHVADAAECGRDVLVTQAALVYLLVPVREARDWSSA